MESTGPVAFWPVTSPQHETQPAHTRIIALGCLLVVTAQTDQAVQNRELEGWGVTSNPAGGGRIAPEVANWPVFVS